MLLNYTLNVVKIIPPQTFVFSRTPYGGIDDFGDEMAVSPEHTMHLAQDPIEHQGVVKSIRVNDVNRLVCKLEIMEVADHYMAIPRAGIQVYARHEAPKRDECFALRTTPGPQAEDRGTAPYDRDVPQPRGEFALKLLVVGAQVERRQFCGLMGNVLSVARVGARPDDAAVSGSKGLECGGDDFVELHICVNGARKWGRVHISKKIEPGPIIVLVGYTSPMGLSNK